MLSETQRLNVLPWNKVDITGGFWGQRQRTNSHRTIPAITHQMKITGRLDAWKLDWKPGQTPPHIFWDSDTGKWIEAAAYSLASHPDAELERVVEETIALIEQAQQPDGYLNIYYTAVEPDKRWTNLRDRHELYDAGHLIEAAVAYAQATGKDALLNVLTRYADHINERFGPGEGQKHGYPGHPELELALVRLAHQTGDERYFNLSKYFVDERGQQPHYFDLEAQARGDDPQHYWAKNYRYCQAHLPIREQTEACGHSVRAAYLYAGVADIAAETSDSELANVLRKLWDDLTTHQMYVTAGLGPAHTNEGFTFAYDLPNETAYAETCASIALAFWGQRMFNLDPDRRYTDILERALYNGVLAGVSYEGDRFFYANPLASYPMVNPFESWSGITSDQYYRRSEWFDCACCPPNLARIVAGIGAYFYSVSADTLYTHLYNDSHTQIDVAGAQVQLDQKTSYPWDGQIDFSLTVDQPTRFKLALRIPGWCHGYQLAVNGEAVNVSLTQGYAVIERTWQTGDTVSLTLMMPVERIAPHPEIRQDAGCVALQRGPVVYCLEQADNGPRLANVVLPREARLSARFEPTLFDGVTVITGEGLRAEPVEWPQPALYSPQSALQYAPTPMPIKAIPYFLWANREPGEMRVWIRES